MANSPARICPCGHRVPHGVLCACQKQRKAAADKARPSARERGYDTKWDKERAAYLKVNMRCRHNGCGKPATVVHHIIAHKGNLKLFWNRSNWMPVCKECHDGPLQRSERSQPGGGSKLSAGDGGPDWGGLRGRNSNSAKNLRRKNGS